MTSRSWVHLVGGVIFGGAMVAVAMVQLQQANERSAEATVRLAADSYLRTFEAMRGLYTSDVVNRLPETVEITHDYLAHENSVPLPATFTIALAERLGRSVEGLSIRLYSEYPFPFRGPTEMDDFERMALDSLKASPSAVISAVEGDDASRVLRYALGDTMRLECVTCHNAHPESPKRDWEVGDLRGVLAVSILMTSFDQRAREARRPYTMLLLLALLGLLGAGVVLMQDLGRSRGQNHDD